MFHQVQVRKLLLYVSLNPLKDLYSVCWAVRNTVCLCSAEIPLDVLMKQYAGAYAEGFEWPQSSLQSDDDDMDDTEGVSWQSDLGLAPALVT